MAEVISSRQTTRYILFTVFILSLITALGACTGTAPQADSEPEAATDATTFVDWDQVDWKFDRFSLSRSAISQSLRGDNLAEAYRTETAYSAILDPVDLDAFKRLTTSEREHRRDLARKAYAEAMALKRTVDRGWEIWRDSRRASVPKAARSYRTGIITPTLKHLKNATGLDPTNPFPWYDLSYFAGVVGDRSLQRHALSGALRALADEVGTDWHTDKDRGRLRLRLLLDGAWLDRDEGFFQAGLDSVRQALTQMSDDDLRTIDEAREALLLEALLLVDLDRIYEARQLARDLPAWRLPVHRMQGGMYVAPEIAKTNLGHIESNFAREWVWMMTFLKHDERDQALSRMHEKDYQTEFPPHLNYRFWHDRGRILESFGEYEEADLAYGFSVIYHPYFPYFPLHAGRGLSRVMDQTGVGRPFFLGYQTHYISGSLFSFAAGRVTSLERATDPVEQIECGHQALAALDACLRRDERPASALALRGRVHFRMGDDDQARTDLTQAHDALTVAGRPSPQVLKLLAVIDYNHERYADCLTWVNAYLDLNPSAEFGWRLKGLALTHLNQLNDALPVLDYACRLAPDEPSGWYNLALVHLHRGDVEQARALLQEAGARFPDNADLARLAELIRSDPRANVQLTSQTVQVKQDQNEEIWFERTEHSVSATLVAGMSKDEAKALLPEARAQHLTQPLPETRLILAQVLLKTDQPTEVQKLLAPLWPDRLHRAEAFLLLAADRDLGRPERALAAVDRLRNETKRYPDSEFWTLVGVICLETGAIEEAHLAIDYAQELDPDNTALQKLRF